MRVAIVTESFLPQVNGVTNSVLRVVEHLRGRGDDVLVVAPGLTGPAEYRGAPVVRIPAVDLPVVNSLPIGLPTRTVLTALTGFRPDVVHLASPFVVGARGLAAARRLRVPTVAVYQTDIAGFATAYGLGLGARAAWRWVRRLHAKADRTLAPSSDSVADLREHGIPRVHRWGRGVDIERFSPDHADPELRARLAPNGELLVGFVGRLAPEKEVDRLVSLAGVPGVRVVVVGDGPELEPLRERIPGAAFLGALYGDELATAYASLDVFVHTGPYETFCQAVQEAMASGLPVLAPAAGGPKDLVLPGRTGYLLPADRAGFARELVERVDDLRDPALRARLGQKARKVVLGRTWPAVCGELVEHYEAVTGRVARAA
ncbi:phosphatidylinositol alpha 1,6-mannosyltransferase [Amycolatopsis bartoniae]|uniref:GDP-mannose-dependent alpha-mannosyltransferase n=1 Tax=Amycolatopsis bartoniae TaxID=941986 RepID=A0A8H9IYV7_9PSEU|nr:glycosyltransferase family 1 protein [Amycolatopsis bartoniae]MBB2933679.1 phosphatidylinositol alpha 1,6-mannosyltransferase [Amycolatopsis bartoniae]GHF72387.1 GDP-mannose-dependent alpha-mannosyltransferase [Amycolatopsis bartoniae]